MSSGTDNNKLLIKKRSPNNNGYLGEGGATSNGSSRPSSSGGPPNNTNNGDKVTNGLYSKHNIQVLNNKRSLNSKLFMKPSIIHHPNSNLRPLHPIKPNQSSHDSSSRSSSILANNEDEELIPESTTDDLTSTLLMRLKKLEQSCAEQKIDLNSKDQQLKDLQHTIGRQKTKLELLGAEKEKQQSTINTLIRYMDNAGLKHSFKSLSTDASVPSQPREKFTKNTTQLEEDTRSKSPKSNNDDDLGSRINMKVLEQRVEALNNMIDEEELVEVSRNGNIKQLKPKPVCRVTFWKNGIIVEGGPFKPYKWDITKAFLTDILDGYFPYEFKEKHPEGVKLKIIDKTSEDYSRQVERTVGMNTYLKDNEGSNIKGMDYLKYVDENGKDQSPIDKKALLERLPKQVIKNGKVIPIRDEVEKVITKETPSTSQDTPSVIEIQDVGISEVNPKELCTIKMKSFNKQFIISIHKSKTIQDLRTLLLAHMEGNDSFRMKAIPNTFFDDPTITLEQGKLFPKAILMILDKQ